MEKQVQNVLEKDAERPPAKNSTKSKLCLCISLTVVAIIIAVICLTLAGKPQDTVDGQIRNEGMTFEPASMVPDENMLGLIHDSEIVDDSTEPMSESNEELNCGQNRSASYYLGGLIHFLPQMEFTEEFDIAFDIKLQNGELVFDDYEYPQDQCLEFTTWHQYPYAFNVYYQGDVDEEGKRHGRGVNLVKEWDFMMGIWNHGELDVNYNSVQIYYDGFLEEF